MRSDRRAVDVFAENVRNLLMAAPLGTQRVIGIEGQAVAPGEGESLSRLLDVALEIVPQIPEPDEFSGGLEWNV